MISEAQIVGAAQVLQKDWVSRSFLDDEGRSTVLNATLRHFGPSWQRDEIIQNVKNDPEVKKIIPVFVITAILGWVIEKILDYFWNTYTQGDEDMMKGKVQAAMAKLPPEQQAAIKSVVGNTKTSDLSELMKGISIPEWSKPFLIGVLDFLEASVVPKLAAINPSMGVVLSMVLEGMEASLKKV